MRCNARLTLFHGPGQPLTVAEQPAPTPRDGEILVRVAACTICSSDVHTFTGRRAEAVPTVLGHEVIGHIEELGPAAPRNDVAGQPLRPGDRITWSIAASCGRCFFCTHELPQKCATLRKYGHESLNAEQPFRGGLADVCVLAPGTAVVRLPGNLEDAIACPVNCAMATAAAALRAAGGCMDKVVLVQGAGVLGLTTCAMAHKGGAHAVLCTDVLEARLATARLFGADAAELAGSEEARNRIAEWTDGRGVDVVVELAGAVNAIDEGLLSVRVGGVYVWAGAVLPLPPLALAPEAVVRRCLTIRGVHNYAAEDLLAAVRFLGEHRHSFPWERLLGQVFPLTEVNAAFAWAAQHPGQRAVVLPEGANSP